MQHSNDLGPRTGQTAKLTIEQTADGSPPKPAIEVEVKDDNLDPALDYDPFAKIEYLNSLAETRQKQGDKDTARQIYQFVVHTDGGNEKALFGLAYLTENCYEARDRLKTLLEYHPDNQAARKFLSLAEARIGEIEEMMHSSQYLKTLESREKSFTANLRESRDNRSEPVHKIGNLLLQNGYVTEQQLDTAVHLHQLLARSGVPKPLGQVLVEYGYVSSAQLEEILRIQEDEYRSQFY